MTYEELLPILEKNGFYCEKLTKDDRCLYVYSRLSLTNNTDNRNVLAVLDFDQYKPKLEEIQFYSKFYITKDGIATEDTITVDWADNDFYNEITPEKVDKKFQKMALRIKTLAERAKLKRIKADF
ncbi:MAG: hypothetical protein J6V44_04800 [Methanobrevibacter sp.]|nr:hypothetical protein [Methanobrevibacter sp.]